MCVCVCVWFWWEYLREKKKKKKRKKREEYRKLKSKKKESGACVKTDKVEKHGLFSLLWATYGEKMILSLISINKLKRHWKWSIEFRCSNENKSIVLIGLMCEFHPRVCEKEKFPNRPSHMRMTHEMRMTPMSLYVGPTRFALVEDGAKTPCSGLDSSYLSSS